MRAPQKIKAVKPPPLTPGGLVRLISPAFPAQPEAVSHGIAELERIGYRVRFASPEMKADGYFAGSQSRRVTELKAALADPEAHALISIRGGYGSGALLGDLKTLRGGKPKLVIGFSDITMLQVFLWQKAGWTSVHGPMVAAGLNRGEDQPHGYDRKSFANAVSGAQRNWSINLAGDSMVRGEATGTILGGCLTLIQTTLGTAWSLDTRGSILLLEDVGMKPYQVDRALIHLAQADKFHGVRGVVLGEFPDSDPPTGTSTTVRDVCRRVFGRMGIPVIFGAAFGHTSRPMLTMPLGVRARLKASGEGKLEILEAPVAQAK